MSVTNLDFIKVGGIYPPREDTSRLFKYSRYKEIFDSKLGEAYNSFLKGVGGKAMPQSVIDGMNVIFSNPRIMNYGRAITKKTVDLAISRKPHLAGKTDKNDLRLIDIARETQVWKKVKMSLIDVSRYGNGYIREYNVKARQMQSDGTLTNGEVGCNVLDPCLVTTVVDPQDKEHITEYVIGWVDEVIDNVLLNGSMIEQREYFLTLEIHRRGEYQYKRFRVSDPIVCVGTIKQYTLIEDVTPNDKKDVWFKTGLEGFAIKNLIGFATSDDPLHGLSDYDMFDSLMIDLCERVSQLSEVFEKHGNPSMQGSEKLMSTDENGNPVFYTGDFYPLQQGDVPLSYITWDAKAKEILDYCNSILQQIFILSEMGDGSIMGYVKDSNGFAESGKAMRIKMASPLMKVQSLLSDNEDEIISIIHDFSVIRGENIPQNEIEVTWFDGLPIDWVEETNNFNSRVQTGTESIKYGLQRRFNMTPDEAEDEWEQILKEQKELSKVKEKKVSRETEKNTLQNNMNGANIKSDTRETTENKLDGKNSNNW